VREFRLPANMEAETRRIKAQLARFRAMCTAARDRIKSGKRPTRKMMDRLGNEMVRLGAKRAVARGIIKAVQPLRKVNT
jgi:hypothetical protein